MRRTLYRYVAWELATPFALCFSGLSILFLAGRGAQLTDYMTLSPHPVSEIWDLLILALPDLLLYVLPASTVVAVLTGLARLHSDNELVALRLAGVGSHWLLLPVLTLAAAAAALCFVLAFRVAPTARGLFRERTRMLQSDLAPRMLRTGRFTIPLPGVHVFVSGFDRAQEQAKGVIIHDARKPEEATTLFARTAGARPSPGRRELVLELRDGYAAPEGTAYPALHGIAFDRFFVRVPVPAATPSSPRKRDRKTMTAAELRKAIHSETPAVARSCAVELHRRFAVPLGCIVLAFCVAALGGRFRQPFTGMSGFVVGLILFLAYYLLGSLGHNLAREGSVSVVAGPWAANVLFAVLGVWLWQKRIRS